MSEGSVVIDGNEILSFGASFKDIVFQLSNCDDQITITKTHNDSSSIEIIAYNGIDTIELGDSSQPFDTNIVGNIIIDGGADKDSLIIKDQTLVVSKPVQVRSTLITGIQASNKTISYFDIENIDMSFGAVAAQVEVLSTPPGASLHISTQGKWFEFLLRLAC